MTDNYTQRDIDRAKSDGNLSSDIRYIIQKVDGIERKLEGDFVKIESFEPVRNLVYGLTGLVLVGVFGAIVSLVIKSH